MHDTVHSTLLWPARRTTTRHRAAGTDSAGRNSTPRDISPEHGTPPWNPASTPQPESATSWRLGPQRTVTWQELTWFLLGAVLLICLGILLGAAWTTQALRPKLHQLARERQRLNQAWTAVRTAHRQLDECPRCGYPLSDQGWGFAPTVMEGPPEDD